MLTATYPALFYYDDSDGIEAVYSIHFPNFPFGATQGNNINNAMEMASDWLGIMVSDYIEKGDELPEPYNINKLSLEENNPFKEDKDFKLIYEQEKSFISLVSVDLTEYLNQNTLVKKTLTIPLWADKAAKKFGLNFSQTLTEAILQKTMPSQK